MKHIPLHTAWCGDYYIGDAGTGFRRMSLRRLCRRVKTIHPDRWGRRLTHLVENLAACLATGLPKDAVIVPVPTSGNPYTQRLAELICLALGGDAAIAPVLRRNGTASLYGLKKAGRRVTEGDTCIAPDVRPFKGVPAGRPVVLVDNVIATGVTMSAAIGALVHLGADEKDITCAALACDTLTYREHVAAEMADMVSRVMTRSEVLDRADHDRERSFGFVLGWLCDMTGLPKRECWNGAAFWCWANGLGEKPRF